jgi:hypothetical protein
VPNGGRSCGGNGNVNDDGESEDDCQSIENGTRKGKRIKDGKGKWTATENRKGKRNGKEKGKGNSTGKGDVKQTPGEMISLLPLH